MKKIITILAGALLCCGGAPAQQAKPLTMASVQTAGVQYAIAPPPDNTKLISETPEGTETLYKKSGVGYGYSMFVGMVNQTLDGAISNVVVSDDGSKVYMQSPIFLDMYSYGNWIEGSLQDDVVTFTFPQLIDHEIYYDEDGEVDLEYRYYAMKLEFVVNDEDAQSGWYYPCENQEYKMHLSKDGTLTPLESEIMIGNCLYYGEDYLGEGSEPYYSWQASGDVLTKMSVVTEKPLEVPEGVEFTEWQMITDMAHRPVYVGVKDDAMYVKGLFSQLEEAAVVGKIEGNKVIFQNGQYLGAYIAEATLAYFDTGIINEEEDFKKTSEMVFTYDYDKLVLTSEEAYCVSSSPDKIIYYVIVDKPYIFVPSADATVTSLHTPILSGFYDVDEKFGYDAEMYFIIPTIDPEYNILDTDYLFYEVILDNDIYTFYGDEYELPGGADEMTQIPYGYTSEYTNDFDSEGNDQGFILHALGFESLGVRLVYNFPDKAPVYSGVLWAPGYEGELSAIKGVNSNVTVKEIEYYDMNGLRVSRPKEAGMYICKKILTDGNVLTSKVMRR